MARKKAATVAAPPPPPPVYTAVTHTIALDPIDWYLAAWRKTPPVPRPSRLVTDASSPPAFDLNACLERLNRIYLSSYNSNWYPATIADTLSRQEAHFWFAAITGVQKDVKTKEYAKSLGEQTYDGKLTLADVKAKLTNLPSLPTEILKPLANLLTAEEFANLLTSNTLTGDSSNTYTWTQRSLALSEAFARQVLPYLTEEERAAYRPVLRPCLDRATWPAGHSTTYPPLGPYVAALIGTAEEVLALVSSWPDDAFTTGYSGVGHSQQPQRLLFGLGDPRLVEQHARRLKLGMTTPFLIRGWLAHTEVSALDWVRDAIINADKQSTEKLTKTLALVRAPEVAPFMLDIRLNVRNHSQARHWLTEQVGNTIVGLLPTATGRGKVAEAALDYLRDAKRKGHAALIEEGMKLTSPEVADKIRRLVLEHVVKTYQPFDDATTPAWLKKAMEETQFLDTKLPDWVSPDVLPALSFGEQCLNEAQFRAVLDALRNSTLTAPLPLVKALKANCDPMVLDAFAWKLFDLWHNEDMPSKEKWAFLSVAHLGGDGCVLKLTPLVRAWPGESAHQRAVTGLECLRTIGTDTALMQLNGISQKIRFAGLKSKAKAFMEDIARDKGLSPTELEDRIVPDLDLDARGSRSFDFGPRQFKLAFGEDMKPMIREESGKLKTDLPKPGKTDDTEKAGAAVAAWKLLKKQVKEVIKAQVTRLEQAMVACRRWPPSAFESYLVKHPLMINLVRLLLWGGYDEKGKLVRSFRVTEEQDYATVDDTACKLEGLTTVGVVHPLHLSDEDRAAWGEVFSDYELLPPFPQLARRVQKLQPGEEKETKITRFHGPKINPMALLGILEKTGWTRGSMGGGGVYYDHTRHFPGSNVTAVLAYEPGISVSYLDGSGDQQLTETYFLAGTTSSHRDKLKLGEVDPVAISEVLDILSVLASKGT